MSAGNFTGSISYWGDEEELESEKYWEDEEELERHTMFQNKGSALRRATSRNPRNLPCPTCLTPNQLTPKDVRLGYQCDTCADRAEGLIYW